MCGRLTLTSGDYESVARDLEATVDPRVSALASPRYNAAPRDEMGVLLIVDGERRIVPARWGFSRPRPPDESNTGDASLINARAENLLERRTFRGPVEGRGRCVVPSDGFFEWSGPKGQRQPHWFHRAVANADAVRPPLMPFAGLVREEEGELRFVVLTLASSPFVARFHHRMPAMLQLDAVGPWLAGLPVHDPEPLELWLARVSPPDLTAYPVSRRVNKTGARGPELIERVEPPPPPPEQISLFGDGG